MDAPDRGRLVSQPFVGADIAAMRALVAQQVSAAGLVDGRRADFVLAVDEILSNAVRHGQGRGLLEVWVSGNLVWFRVTDYGQGMTVPAVAQRPDPNQPGGRGLWITEQVTDELRISSGPTGTVVTGGMLLHR